MGYADGVVVGPQNPNPARRLMPRDVQVLAGLSYRQLNQWESRGAVPHRRGRDAGWRRFSPSEVFTLMVCAKVRRRLNVPLQSLKWLRKRMLQHGIDHLDAALRFINAGEDPCLLTDLRETLVLDSGTKCIHLLLNIDNRDSGIVIFLKIDDIAKRLREHLALREQPNKKEVYVARTAARRKK
jgi:DNA-binding transcriptional MerR regulator